MAMPIAQLMVDPGAAIYYDPDFRRVLETHMGLLRTASSTTTATIEPQDGYKYEYDFYGYLQFQGVSESLHWVILRMNDMIDPKEFRVDRSVILIPAADAVDSIRKLHMTVASKM